MPHVPSTPSDTAGRTVRVRTTGRAVLAALAAFALVAAACGESVPDGETAGSPSPAPTVTVTETVAASPSPSPSPGGTESATPDPPSPATSPDDAAASGGGPALECEQQLQMDEDPPEAERLEEASADLDGDGAEDRLLTFAFDDGSQTQFFLRVYTDAGFSTEVVLDEASALAPVRPLGGADIGAGRDVAFIQERVGASAAVVTLWGLHDLDAEPCALARVTVPDHTAGVGFPVGGSSGSGSGLVCRDVDGDGADDLVARSVQSVGDDTYESTFEAWSWPGAGALTFVGGSDEPATYRHPEDREEIEASYGLDCAGVAAP